MKNRTTHNGFRDEYRFLSNVWKVPIHLKGIEQPFPSVENAYQASKTNSEKLRRIFTKLSAGEAKTVGQNILVRPEWDNQLRIETMRTLLFQKFDGRDPELVKKLLSTGDIELIEVNDWEDTFFGVCSGVGENRLGKLLMEVRLSLQ